MMMDDGAEEHGLFIEALQKATGRLALLARWLKTTLKFSPSPELKPKPLTVEHDGYSRQRVTWSGFYRRPMKRPCLPTSSLA